MTTTDNFLHEPDLFPDVDDTEVPGPETMVDEDRPRSDLDLLRADLTKAIVEEVTLPVPARPGYSTVHAADINANTMEGLRRRAKTKTGLDAVKLVSLIMASTNVAIVKDGRRLVTEGGDPLNFRSAEFLDIMGESTAALAVRKFYHRDGDLDAASRALTQAAGWGVELEASEGDDIDNPSVGRA